MPDENVGSFSPEREFMGAKASYGNVAQLAEHLTVNQRGAGSSPAVSAIRMCGKAAGMQCADV